MKGNEPMKSQFQFIVNLLKGGIRETRLVNTFSQRDALFIAEYLYGDEFTVVSVEFSHWV
jgi:hypothetical protein